MLDSEFVLRRSYGWGVLFVLDAVRKAAFRESGGARITGDESGIVIPVRHAQDVGSDESLAPDAIVPHAWVVVEGGVGDTTEPVDFDGILEATDGRILIGDPDADYVLRLTPGWWRVRVALDDPEFAEHVRLWFSPAP